MVVRSVLGLGINDGNIVITTMYGSKVITNGKRSHMEKIKQLWTLTKANPKISAAIVVGIIAIYILAN